MRRYAVTAGAWARPGLARACFAVACFALVCLAWFGPAGASAPASPPETGVSSNDLGVVPTVRDTPSDGGTSLTITWDASATPRLPGLAAEGVLSLERRARGEDSLVTVGSAAFGDGRFVDEGLAPGTAYAYVLAWVDAAGNLHTSGLSLFEAPRENAFRAQRVNALIAILLMTGLVAGFILSARRGRSPYIRRIAGLDAIDEAVGRATEMGRKILYVPGIISVNEPQTLASLGILGYVAKLTARYGAELEVPNIDALAMAAGREIVKQSYMEEGHPEAFREDMVHYITDDQFAYAAALSGIMVRDRPAANFLIGWFAAESLLLAETGQSINAIQIAGTAQVAQLPFFVSACDYTMLGEELFAASAYLSRDPLILGSIAGQDMMKIAIALAIVLGVLFATAGATGFVDWFTAL